jgi:hypothetical protein
MNLLSNYIKILIRDSWIIFFLFKPILVIPKSRDSVTSPDILFRNTNVQYTVHKVLEHLTESMLISVVMEQHNVPVAVNKYCIPETFDSGTSSSRLGIRDVKTSISNSR